MKNSEQRFVSEVSRYDEILRKYMIKIYNYIAAALVLTGSIAMFTADF